MNFDDYGTRIMAYDCCSGCGVVHIKVPYQLLTDMLKNCKQSSDRDILINRLRHMQKSDDLSSYLNREKIWSLVDNI